MSMTPQETDDITTRATARFGVLRSLCYPEAPPTSAWRSVDTFEQRTTTHARTNGRRLTKLNVGYFQKADIESQFVALLHEVTHANDGSSYGRGDSAHSPSFWEEFQQNFNTLLSSPQNRVVVESVFNERGDKFNWHRSKYRAVQQVSQVDKRSETVDERRRKMAEAIEYDGYDQFENSNWGLHGLVHNPEATAQTRALQANLFVPTQRFADDYSDEELLDFIEEQGGHAPMPLVVLDVDDWSDDSPQIVRDDDAWLVCRTGRTETKKALAVQERLGLGYHGLSAELLAMSDLESYVENACPIDVSDVQPRRIDIQKESGF